MQVLQIIVLLKRTNSNLTPGYALMTTFETLNAAVQALEMILMLNRAHSNISYGYSKNTANIFINNKINYAYSSEMT